MIKVKEKRVMKELSKFFHIVPVKATIKKINKHGALGGYIEMSDSDYKKLKRLKKNG